MAAQQAAQQQAETIKKIVAPIVREEVANELRKILGTDNLAAQNDARDKQLRDYINDVVHRVEVSLGELSVTLQKDSSRKKPGTTTKPSGTSTTSTTAEAPTKFPTNKRMYFMQKWKEPGSTYRTDLLAKHAFLAADLLANDKVKNSKTDVSKLNAEAVAAYSILTEKVPGYGDILKTEYDEQKQLAGGRGEKVADGTETPPGETNQ